MATDGKKRKRVSFGSTSKFSYEKPERLNELERGFVLDGVCLSHLANDETDRTFPSLNIGEDYISRYSTVGVCIYTLFQVFHNTKPSRTGTPRAIFTGKGCRGSLLITMTQRYDISIATAQRYCLITDQRREAEFHARQRGRQILFKQ